MSNFKSRYLAKLKKWAIFTPLVVLVSLITVVDWQLGRQQVVAETSIPTAAAVTRQEILEGTKAGDVLFLQREQYSPLGFRRLDDGADWQWPDRTIQNLWISANPDGWIDHFVAARYAKDGTLLAILESRDGTVHQIDPKMGAVTIQDASPLDQLPVSSFIESAFSIWDTLPSKNARFEGARIVGGMPGQLWSIPGQGVVVDGKPRKRYDIVLEIPDHNPLLARQHYWEIRDDGSSELTRQTIAVRFEMRTDFDLPGLVSRLRKEIQR